MTDTTTDTAAGIVPENLLAVQAIYFAYVLEELRMFQAIERLAQLFTQGLLPIGTPATRNALIAMAFGSERLTAQDRRSLYARALGATDGEAGHAEPNRAFLSLWLRYLGAIVAYAERHPAAGVLAPPGAANADVRRAARALAANASAHGGGLTRRMAGKLLAEVHAALDLLGSADVLAAYGARDAWQVIDLLNRSELGGARNVARFRSQAVAGSHLLRWLAEHRELLDDGKAAAATPDGALLVDAAGQVLWLGGGSADETAEPAAPAEAGAPPRPAAGALLRRLLDGIGDGHASVTVFQGDRHTGKTIAAHLLAQTLGKDVLRVDLAEVIGKYVGETEKNLDAVLRRAEEADAVLLLEEADALFGRRSQVKDAHDRYANLDTSELLQRMEAHAAPVVLATNRRQHIDPAFVRRLRFVDFPR